MFGEDLFTFTATKAGRYTIETSGPTDLVMKLFGPDYSTSLIAEDDDSVMTAVLHITRASQLT